MPKPNRAVTNKYLRVIEPRQYFNLIIFRNKLILKEKHWLIGYLILRSIFKCPTGLSRDVMGKFKNHTKD